MLHYRVLIVEYVDLIIFLLITFLCLKTVDISNSKSFVNHKALDLYLEGQKSPSYIEVCC